jgi:hypothetical protein
VGHDLIYHLGFLLPKRVTEPDGKEAPRDSEPRHGICDYCKRMRQETYARWDGARVCDICLDGQVNRVKKMRLLAPRRSPLLRPVEKTGIIGDRFDEAFWERQLS